LSFRTWPNTRPSTRTFKLQRWCGWWMKLGQHEHQCRNTARCFGEGVSGGVAALTANAVKASGMSIANVVSFLLRPLHWQVDRSLTSVT
jgi:hypothetical protein